MSNVPEGQEEKIHVNQNWRLTFNTNEDQTLATVRQIKAKAPGSNTVQEFTASLDPEDSTKIFYDFIETDITIAGTWKFWPYTTISLKNAPGNTRLIEIYEEGE